MTSTRSALHAWLSLMALLACALAIGCGGGHSSGPTTARAAYTQAVPVGVASVQKRDMPVYLVGLGSVTPLYSVNVKTRVDGQLVRVNFKEGQFVHKGDQLALIDP